jgi:hypothetical protein
LLQLPGAPKRHANVDSAIDDQVVALSSPRLHRAP